MYKKEDIYKALEDVIKEKHEVVFISGNLGFLGEYKFSSKKELIDTIIEIIIELSKGATILTSTFTLNLANTNIPFDIHKTKSIHGAIANYFIEHKDSVRSMHPFTSFTAIGEKAEYLCTNNSRFSYGIDSPYDRMLSLENPLTISIGLPPNLTCSLIHHVEHMMHVPYRYIKEFEHPVIINGNIIYETFYMHVIYHEIYDEIKRNKNIKFFNEFKKENTIYEAILGKGKIYSYRAKDFYNKAIELLKKDIYFWLDEPPKKRPYRR